MSYFGKVDPTARQYSLIIQSLLQVTTSHVKKKQLHLRMQRKQASSQLFGLLPSEPERRHREPDSQRTQSLLEPIANNMEQAGSSVTTTPLDWAIYDADFFALPWPSENDQGLQDFLRPGTHNLDGASVADIPLFPIYDQQVGTSYL